MGATRGSFRASVLLTYPVADLRLTTPRPTVVEAALHQQIERRGKGASRAVSDGQGVMVMVNCWDALVSSPPFAVPPLSFRTTVTVTVVA